MSIIVVVFPSPRNGDDKNCPGISRKSSSSPESRELRASSVVGGSGSVTVKVGNPASLALSLMSRKPCDPIISIPGVLLPARRPIVRSRPPGVVVVPV